MNDKTEPTKFILDACCGNRMMWVNKKHPNTIYHDQRGEVNPDIVGDFRELKSINSNSLKLVVIDPPHDIYHRKANNDSGFQRNFGNLNPDTWQEDLKKGLSECWRVLEDYGVLIFKWNTHDAKIHRIMPLLPAEPLFMNKLTKLNTHNSETIWFCFMKIPIANPSTSATPTLAEPKEFNMGDKVSATPSPKEATLPSHHPNIMRNLKGGYNE